MNHETVYCEGSNANVPSVWAKASTSIAHMWRLLNTPLPYTCVRSRETVKPTSYLGFSVPIYKMSSWFLKDCLDYLTASPDESLHYVTAIEDGGRFYITMMIGFRLKRQSSCGAEGDLQSTHEACVQADSFRHTIAGVFHSHPGLGALATMPSATDLATQERFERGGYPAIGAIFARDGHVRFFTHRRPFSVDIFGDRVTRIQDHVFKLSLDKALPL